jgi:chromosome segregation ATPase
MSTAQPATPHGRQLLAKTLTGLNLPPEEWAVEVRELNAQLVECLECLFEREAELNEQADVVQSLETNVIAVKQQLAALYYDHSKRSEEWRAAEQHLRSECSALNNERDDLRLRVRRAEETISLLQKEDDSAMESKLRELSRRVAIYEVNEAVLSRKYTAQADQLALELERRQQLESEAAEAEGTLKRRVLYLEQAKLYLGQRLERVEARLSRAAPLGDYKQALDELDGLRDDHLSALRREMDCRLSLLKSQSDGLSSDKLRDKLAYSESELSKYRDMCSRLEAQLREERSLTQNAIAASESASELSAIVADCSRYRIEASRLEVDLAAHKRATETLSEQVKLLRVKERELVKDVEEARLREEHAHEREQEARTQLSQLKQQFEGGLGRVEAEQLRIANEQQLKELEKARAEMGRLNGIAEIASQQALAVANSKRQAVQETAQLLEQCSRIESRSEDDLIIGRLQRQLMTTKASYRAFANKYHTLRADVNQRELAIRALEQQLELRQTSIFDLQVISS